MNKLKTVKMITDFRRHASALLPLTISHSGVLKIYENYLSQDLKGEYNINYILKNAQQRMCFPLQLKKCSLPQELLNQFYTVIIKVQYKSISVMQVMLTMLLQEMI